MIERCQEGGGVARVYDRDRDTLCLDKASLLRSLPPSLPSLTAHLPNGLQQVREARFLVITHGWLSSLRARALCVFV